jgi:uncharacterized protein YqiB (DUF1249 family)
MSLINDLKKKQSDVIKVKSVIEENYEVIKKLSDQLEQQYSEELDTYIKKVKGVLDKIRDGEEKYYSDDYLEYHVLRLPVALFFMVEGMEDLGGKQDLSKIHKDEAYAEAYAAIIEGTIPDKESKAKQQVIAETLMMEIYKRAYSKLKKKFERAMEVHASLKKALDHRIVNKEVFRRDTPTSGAGEEVRREET